MKAGSEMGEIVNIRRGERWERGERGRGEEGKRGRGEEGKRGRGEEGKDGDERKHVVYTDS